MDYVDLGGDIRVIGPHPDGKPWQVGIRHPRKPDSLMAMAEIEQGDGNQRRLRAVIRDEGRRYGRYPAPCNRLAYARLVRR